MNKLAAPRPLSPEALAADLGHVMVSDRYRLARRLERLKSSGRRGEQAGELEKVAAEIAASRARRQERLAGLPRPAYPLELPVVTQREEILTAIEAHPVVIVCGETGSGKTTQLPKLCLELKRGVAGMIGHTQPRRIAARTVAARIAAELQSPLGEAVGYRVRFSDRVGEGSYIKVMTDGILLAETQGDPLLAAYDTLIIDEAHERSLNIDFLLGYVKALLPRRPDLKLVITSATLDAEKFSRHFGGAPVIEVSGRLYPVEIRYRPVFPLDASRGAGETPQPLDGLTASPFEANPSSFGHPPGQGGKGSEGSSSPLDKGEAGRIEESLQERTLTDAILSAVDEVGRIGPGDVLVFLPGEREIRDTAEALRKHHSAEAEILPLYARLSYAEQERVFRPSGTRRIVLATNVAETSLTVPGIRYVIDTGLARLNRYSYRNKVEQLRVEKISRASADQRSGRCGRVQSGVCIRLYSEEDYASRPRFTDPEILRSSLASVILRMKALNLGEPESFPFVDPPLPKAIADGYQLLAELSAVDEARRLTATGRALAKLPIDPRIARMVLAAKQEGCLKEVLVIGSALEVEDPRERPLERREAADQAHRKFQDERSDFLAYLKLWEFFEQALQHKKSNRKLAEQCQEHFLSYPRMREWRDVHGQLHALVTAMGMRPNEIPASFDEIHRALLAGLLGNIGMKGEEAGEYQGARGIRFYIHPGSALRKKAPKWVMAAELTETTRLYARCVAAIEPEWIEQVAGRLCKRAYLEPHWEKRTAQVVAFEQVSLYGLILIPRRRVHYGPIDPRISREIFLRALAAGEYPAEAPFFQHNQRLVAEIEELEHKSRRLDVLVDEERMFQFYCARVPEGIYNGITFERWRKDAEAQNPRLLFMAREDLMRHEAEGITEALYPDRLRMSGVEFKLSYRFEPGHPLDGVTLNVPLPLLNQLDPRPLDWLVPGLLREKVNALIRSLPKPLRRAFVPLPEIVTACLTELEGEDRFSLTLTQALSFALKKLKGVDVPLEAWDTRGLPPHLLMNYRVVDEAGHELATGRDLERLKQALDKQVEAAFAPQNSWERNGIQAWDFGELPEAVEFERAGQRLVGYPALVDEGEAVALRLMDAPGKAGAATRAGVNRLLRLALKEQVKALERGLSGFQQLALSYAPLGDADRLKEELIRAAVDRAAWAGEEPVRSRVGFESRLKQVRVRLPVVAQEYARLAQEILTLAQGARELLEGATLKPWGHAQADLKRQLEGLVYPGFIADTPWERLQQLPRYLKAMARRAEKLPGNPERDFRHSTEIARLAQAYQQRLERCRKAGFTDPRLTEFRWMLEELRVSLFAQELKTPYPVSVKRLEKFLAAAG